MIYNFDCEKLREVNFTPNNPKIFSNKCVFLYEKLFKYLP